MVSPELWRDMLDRDSLSAHHLALRQCVNSEKRGCTCEFYISDHRHGSPDYSL